MSAPLLEVSGLCKTYPLPRPRLFAAKPQRIAVDGVDFTVEAGRSFGIVGESGSGKSTIARLVMALTAPTAGEVRLEGRSLFALSRAELKATRAHFQMVFQDPYGSLDPRQRIARIVGEPLANVSRSTKAVRVAEALAAVGLGPEAAARYPHEFSGGQRQRIAIARALVTRPKLVVADEPVSALDVSIQAQVLNLMCDLQRDAGVTYLLISHDLAVVGHVCETVAVMFQGRFVETGPADLLLTAPAHPYTRELVEAAPRLEPAPSAESRAESLPPLRGSVREGGGPAPESAVVSPPPQPSPIKGEGDSATTGCRYAPRCPLATNHCLAETPALRALDDGRRVACHEV